MRKIRCLLPGGAEFSPVPYTKAEQIQEGLVQEIIEGADDALLMLQHPPTITFGRNGGEEFLLAGEEFLKTQGIDIVKSSRGGKITCHYPGQLVAYPLMALSRWSKAAANPDTSSRGISTFPFFGLRGFFWGLEEAVIQLADSLNIKAERREGLTGVWTEKGKLCSIGIAVKHGVCYHGLSLNVSQDTSLFKLITLCGLPDALPTSISIELKREISVQELYYELQSNILKLFS